VRFGRGAVPPTGQSSRGRSALSTFSNAVTALGGSDAAREARGAALDRFTATPLPRATLADWRYSRIDALDLDRYDPDLAPTATGGWTAPWLDAAGAATVVTIRNGRLTAEVGGDPAVTVSADPELVATLDGIAGEPDSLVSLNAALSIPLVVDVAPGAVVTGPVIVVHHLSGQQAAAFPRTVVRVGRAAQVNIMEVAVSDDVDGLVVPVTELDIADGANVGYIHFQELGGRVWQLGLQASRVGRDATFLSASVALGGSYARLRTTSAVVGSGATTRLLAVYFGSADRMVDYRTIQDHRAPQTTSELLFKGAVANRSRAVYTGLIRVEKGARGTNAFQTNRNLVLHEGAHAESVPNLEIEDNDVRCSHASAIGPVAEDQRFYLESRGVRPDAAERLITLGFLDEVLERLPVTSAADHARVALAGTLDEAEQIEAAGGTSSQDGGR
jgi:Fe-S cluster assembly protein SufD